MEVADLAEVAGSRRRHGSSKNGKGAGECRRFLLSAELKTVYQIISVCQVVLGHSNEGQSICAAPRAKTGPWVDGSVGAVLNLNPHP